MSEVVIGIDPGSRFTGYGIVKLAGNDAHYLGSGCIKTGDGDLASKLKIIFDGVTALIEQFKPDCMAIEETFLSKNVQSTVKLSEARASAIVAGANLGLSVYEYTPMQIKQSVVGYGWADKTQVQYMVKTILRLNGTPQSDAADALACALCHCFTSKVTRAMGSQVANTSSIHGRLQGVK
ncbi:MAG: crossover junction endodeoxyribonuclease RuvC [Aeromonadales bacterium]|nr:crossover junction endodeoxyribonuclease RuvC [Aeromonadales bacterium]